MHRRFEVLERRLQGYSAPVHAIVVAVQPPHALGFVTVSPASADRREATSLRLRPFGHPDLLDRVANARQTGPSRQATREAETSKTDAEQRECAWLRDFGSAQRKCCIERTLARDVGADF